ncbi:MAG: energy transducer TonB [Burkholderiaceae bacterium]
MPSTTRARHRWHAPEKGSGPAFALSLLAHVVLFIAIAFMVRWKSEPVGTVSAELWSLPPAAVQQPVSVAPPPRPAPVEPPPPAPEPRKADIVIEPKKTPPPKVEPKKVEPPPPPKAEPKKVVPPDPPKKDDSKVNERKSAAERQAALERVLAQAGTGTRPAAAGGLSDAYAAQINSCIRPHIIFNVPEGTRARQFIAEFEVTLLPTGEQAGAPKLLKASGLAAYDQAVERAIRRCDPFPRPKEGAVPRSIPLIFDPVER